MKKIDDILYIEFSDLVTAGVPDGYLRKACSDGVRTLPYIKDPEDGRKNLFVYEDMGPRYRDLIAACYGNPYEYVSLQPIRKLLQSDPKAASFYTQYRYDGLNGPETSLPDDIIPKYSLAAGILNLLLQADENKNYLIRKELKVTVEFFYRQVVKVIEQWKESGKLPGKFPGKYITLRRRMAEYKEKGYECLISHMYGGQSAAKINDELSKSMLIELIDHPNQYDDKLVSIMYNEWAGKNGYKAIERATVTLYRKMNDPYLTGRYGKEKYNRNIRRKVMRERPTTPCLLWESDDNHLDWWFQGDKASEFRKLKGIIVTDSYNDYILGWAVTDDAFSSNIVKMAYLNAIYHIKELTGNYYLPFEVKTDQWNIETLRPFYKGLGHYYDTPVGSKNRGWLENLFGTADWERCMKIGANNYTGHNITAKTPGVNIEKVKADKKYWPHIDEATEQMSTFIERLRTVPRNFEKERKSRQQEWLEAFAEMPEEKKIPITEEQMLLKFGFRHGWQNKITDGGIKPTIIGKTYSYAIPPTHYLQNVGKQMQIIYDPYNMNRVLVTDNDRVRFIANSMTGVAGCMADMQDGGRAFLNKILEEAKADGQRIGEMKIERQRVLVEHGYNTEDIIKLGGGVLKEIKQAAEQSYQRETLGIPESVEYDPLSQM